MVVTIALASFALESVIGAELALFAVFLLSGRQKAASARYLLAGWALCLAALVSGNLLISTAGLGGLADALLFLDLLTPPLLYMYVVEIRLDPRPLVPTDVLHAAPAAIGVLLWKARLIASMDIYVNLCWLAYLIAAGATFIAHFGNYAPRARQRFLMLTFGTFSLVWLLRIIIVVQATGQPSFREGLPFLLVLVTAFAATCIVLLTALRHPDLLTVPGSHVKYALSSADEVDLDELHRRLSDLFDHERPFLDPEFSLATLARLLNASARHVSQLINTRHGMNVSAYINFRRTSVAAVLLTGSAKPIKAIMFEAGFRSKSIFNREFQRNLGSTPSDYRRQAQENGAAQ